MVTVNFWIKNNSKSLQFKIKIKYQNKFYFFKVLSNINKKDKASCFPNLAITINKLIINLIKEQKLMLWFFSVDWLNMIRGIKIYRLLKKLISNLWLITLKNMYSWWPIKLYTIWLWPQESMLQDWNWNGSSMIWVQSTSNKLWNVLPHKSPKGL